MSLLQNLSYKEYRSSLELTKEKCEIIAELAKLEMSFNDTKQPGTLLINTLDRRGFSVSQYKQFLITASEVKTIVVYYQPQTKVAILIANDKYQYLSKLATPSIDCDSLAENLKIVGFLVVTVKNTTSDELKSTLVKILNEIPEDSYCFIFYAGHGCELCNTKCMLGIDCPVEDIEMKHCVTENFVLREAAACKLELCVFIMDMCRITLDRTTNAKMFQSMPDIEDYSIHSKLLLAYSTQPSQAAYEVVQIECSTTIDSNVTYEIKTGDSAKIMPGNSQYVNALCTRLTDDLDVSSLLDKVHADVESCMMRKQKPIKIQCGVGKRSLYDRVKGDVAALLSRIKEVTENMQNCVVYGSTS